MSNTFSEIAFHFPLSDFVGFVWLSTCSLCTKKGTRSTIERPPTENFCKQKTKFSFFLTVLTPIFLALSIIRDRLLAKFRESHFRFGLEHDSVIGAAARTLAATHSQGLGVAGQTFPQTASCQTSAQTGPVWNRHALSSCNIPPSAPVTCYIEDILYLTHAFFWHALLISLVRWELNHSNWSLVVAV